MSRLLVLAGSPVIPQYFPWSMRWCSHEPGFGLRPMRSGRPDAALRVDGVDRLTAKLVLGAELAQMQRVETLQSTAYSVQVDAPRIPSLDWANLTRPPKNSRARASLRSKGGIELLCTPYRSSTRGGCTPNRLRLPKHRREQGGIVLGLVGSPSVGPNTN